MIIIIYLPTQITTAVNFLQNTKVRHTTLLQKQQFLRSKGLTSEEIQLACERAGVFSQDPNNVQPTVINMGITAQQNHQMQMQPLTVFGRIKEALHSMALISGLAYAVYMFWQVSDLIKNKELNIAINIFSESGNSIFVWSQKEKTS